MTNSSTKYLDDYLIDDVGHIVKDTIDIFKGNCGLFSLVFSVYSNKDLSVSKKERLINALLSSTFELMGLKYKLNLEMYEKYALEHMEYGNKFELLSMIPAQIKEDYEAGLKEARELLVKEIEGITESISELFNK
jgi:hypothetical protein